ncbi:MAG: serine/threonine-protein phosphatase [Gammaproteobacteria bacterium]
MNKSSDKPVMVFEGHADEASPLTLPHGEVVYFSTRSPVKETPNEDAIGVIPVNEQTTVLVVADGMGGMPAGEQAARIIVETMVDTMEQKPEEQLMRDAILTGIDAANSNIKDLRNGAGSTVSVVEVSGSQMRSYHAGDSLILLTSSHGNIKYLSMSHSPIGYALECGAIDQVPAMMHDERNLISNYVGMQEMFIHIGPIIDMAPQDTVIVASDALSDNLYEQEISEYIRKGPLLESVNEMIEACEDNMLNMVPDRRCHPDDFSFICFRTNS